MKIQFLGVMPKSGVSGGRLSSWILAESLASVGHSVVYTTDRRPSFLSEFRSFSKVRLNIGTFRPVQLLSKISGKSRYDWTLLFPHHDPDNPDKLRSMIRYAKATSNKVAFFNFETPNFIQDYFPGHFDYSQWNLWQEVILQTDLVVNNSIITEKYARDFYTGCEGIPFVHWHTAINSESFKCVSDTASRKKQFLIFTRAEPKKGLSIIHEILSRELAGYHLVICIGNGKIAKGEKERIENACHLNGMTCEYRRAVLGKEKVQLYKESAALIYPSLFESFGMPPLEALYAKTPVIAFDLPSYQEFSCDLIDSVPPGKTGRAASFREVVSKVIAGDSKIKKIDQCYDQICQIADLNSCGLAGEKFLAEYAGELLGNEVLSKLEEDIEMIKENSFRKIQLTRDYMKKSIELLNPKTYIKYKRKIDKSCKLINRLNRQSSSLVTDKMMDRNNLNLLRNRYLGQRCFIIGNGPSLTVKDLELLINEYTFASNKIYLLFEETNWRPTFYNVEDVLVAEQNVAEIDLVGNALKFFPYYLIEKTGGRFKDSIYYHSIAKKPDAEDFPSFSNNPLEQFYWGSTVIYIQLQLAVFMGFREIYLLGVDYSYILPSKRDENVLECEGEQNHFHKDYRKPGEKWFVPNLDVQMKTFTRIKDQYMKEFNFRVYNATRGGKLEVFERVDLDELVGGR